MNLLYWDIETGPLPAAELEAALPPFDEADVKLGNLKDEARIAAKIAEARARHRENFFERAALDPMTGRVLAFGVRDEDGVNTILCDEDEIAVLSGAWGVFNGVKSYTQFVGFNIFNFDLPFLIRRSWKLGVKVPFARRKRYWPEVFVDLREVWQLGEYQARGSLDSISRFLGYSGKSGDGAEFANLLRQDRQAALDYLARDLELTEAVAGRLLSS